MRCSNLIVALAASSCVDALTLSRWPTGTDSSVVTARGINDLAQSPEGRVVSRHHARIVVPSSKRDDDDESAAWEEIRKHAEDDAAAMSEDGEEGGKHDTSGGTIAGAVVGGFLALLFCLSVWYWFMIRPRRKRNLQAAAAAAAAQGHNKDNDVESHTTIDLRPMDAHNNNGVVVAVPPQQQAGYGSPPPSSSSPRSPTFQSYTPTGSSNVTSVPTLSHSVQTYATSAPSNHYHAPGDRPPQYPDVVAPIDQAGQTPAPPEYDHSTAPPSAATTGVHPLKEPVSPL